MKPPARPTTRLALLFLGAAVGIIIGLALRSEAEAGHPIVNGSCHQAKGAPLMCRTNYTARSATAGAPGSQLLVRNIVTWQGGTAEYNVFDAATFNAEINWTTATGPQDISRQARANDTWNYTHGVIDPDGQLNMPGARGVTYLCNDSYADVCSSLPRAIDIQWSDVYLKPDAASGWSLEKRTTLVAHELGHALGLYHHDDTTALMHPDVNENPNLQGPQPKDFGSTTDCRGSTTVPTDDWGIRCIYGWYESVDLQASDYSPLKASTSGGTVSVTEGGAAQFTLTARNNGTVASSAEMKIRFGGADPPGGGGTCTIASVPPYGGTASCAASTVNWNFGGGNVTVIADYGGVVAETNEANNTLSWGRIGVAPRSPTLVRVCSTPCDLYGFKNNSSIDTGFGVIVQKRTTCSSGTWTQVGSNILLPPKGLTDDVYGYNFIGPGCFRIKVQTLGPIVHSSQITSTGVYFPN